MLATFQSHSLMHGNLAGTSRNNPFLEVPLYAEFGWDTRVHSDDEQGVDEDSEVFFESKG